MVGGGQVFSNGVEEQEVNTVNTRLEMMASLDV